MVAVDRLGQHERWAGFGQAGGMVGFWRAYREWLGLVSSHACAHAVTRRRSDCPYIGHYPQRMAKISAVRAWWGGPGSVGAVSDRFGADGSAALSDQTASGCGT